MTIPKYRVCTASAVVLLTYAVGVLTVRGQESPDRGSRSVRQATFDRASDKSQQTIRFDRRPSQVGDEVEQTVSLQMRLNTSLRQGNELLEKSQTVVRSHQRRVVTTTEVAQDRVAAVSVRYLEATKEITANEAAAPSASIAQPVQGKKYLCRRDPADDAKLIVTDPNGQSPPPEECEIVEQNLEMVGRPNPLAQFLAGRTVAVGETVELAKELAEQLFNLGNRFGEVTQFELVLEKVENIDDMPCAVFLARVEAASIDSSQMRMQLEGPLVMQIRSCRAVRLALTGPIGMSETRGSYSTIYQLLGTGQLKMSIGSAYRDAAQ
jgi:hypothetical protein